MNPSPFFSVVVAAYNVENYIAEALESIISQTFKDWELIIIDDASTDSTATKVVEFLADPRIRLIRRGENSEGGFIPRFEGVKEARGKYIVHLDADDLVLPYHLQDLRDSIEISGADLVIPEMWRFKDSPAQAYKIFPLENFRTDIVWQGKILVKYTLPVWKIGMAGYAVRKEIFLEASKYIRETYKDEKYSDELLSRFIFKDSESVTFISSPYLYRFNSQSITSNKYGEVKRLDFLSNALLKFTEQFYGPGSQEFQGAQKFRLNFLINLYSVIADSKLTEEQKADIDNLLERLHSEREWKNYKGFLSLPYRLILASPICIGKRLNEPVKNLRKLKRKFWKAPLK